jgi:hypothetical protein
MEVAGPIRCRPLPLASVAGARKVCADCPVRSECFDFAMSDLDLYGVWAGLTAQERQKLRWGRVA